MKNFLERWRELNPCVKKLWLIMRLSGLLILLAVFSSTASVYSQATKLTLKMENARIAEVFDAIEQQSEFYFFYNRDVFNDQREVSLDFKNKKVEEILEEVFEGENVEYEIVDRNILIKIPKTSSGISQNSVQQQPAVSGTVTDETGEPLPGVTVVVKGTTQGTVTNANGEYQLNDIPEDAILQYSFVGMQSQEIKVDNRNQINVILKEESIGLNEVVVTGVISGTQRKKLGFTVEKIDSEVLQQVPSTNAANSLVGKVSGIKVSQNSGAPGSDSNIQLRGATSIFGGSNPLIIVDGILTEGRLSDINSEDIESIEVVKGAAASSLYGSRAANGVINITTKRGSGLKEGQTDVVYRTELGQSFMPYIPQKTSSINVDIVDGVVDYSSPKPDGVYNNPYPSVSDPIGQFFDPGFYNTQYLSFRNNSMGGKTSVFGSLQYTDETGVVKLTDGMSRLNFRINADHRVSDRITLRMSNLYSQSRVDHRGDGIWDMFYHADPDADFLADNEDGTPYDVDPNQLNPRLANPLYQINNSINEEERNRFLGHYNVEYKPLENLNFNVAYGIDRTGTSFLGFTPKGLLQAGNDQLTNGSVSRSTSNSVAQTLRMDGFFTKKVGDFLTKFKLQYLYESNQYKSHSGSGTHLAVLGKDVISLEQASENINIGSYESEVVAQNLSGVVYLDYKDKLIFDGLIRQDGVSLFGINERWQTFYRFSGAYRLSEDIVIPGFQELKLRSSYGVAGLRPPFAAQYEVVGLADGNVTSPVSIGNTNLKSSFSHEMELGLDAEFANRFSFTFNYSRGLNKSQILEVPVSATTGFSTQWQNAGELESNFFEATLGVNVIRKQDFTWDLNLMWDHMNQTVVELNRPGYSIVSGGIFRIEEGEKFGTLYGRKFARSIDDVINQVPEGVNAEEHFVVNNEGFVVLRETVGTIDEEPIQMKDDEGNYLETKIGSVIPDFNMNMTSIMNYKKFGVFFVLGYQQGGHTYNHMRRYMMVNGVSKVLDQLGKPDNEIKSNKYYSRLTTWNNNYFVEDATYLKLRELSISYMLNERELSKFLGIENIRLSIIGRNLLTLTKYSGFDPETGKSEEGVDSNVLKFDLSSYPNYSTISGSVQITF